MATSALLGFLADVREHNSLAWMHANEDRKKAAQQEFLALVQTCIDDLAAQGEQVGHLDPKSLVFRINRDTRFSNDKSPYNPVFRAHISPAGRAPVPVGYFVSIAPGNSFAGGGLFAPRLKEAVKLVRDAIAADPETFLSLVEDEAFRARFAFIGMPLKRMPQGYDAETPPPNTSGAPAGRSKRPSPTPSWKTKKPCERGCSIAFFPCARSTRT